MFVFLYAWDGPAPGEKPSKKEMDRLFANSKRGMKLFDKMDISQTNLNIAILGAKDKLKVTKKNLKVTKNITGLEVEELMEKTDKVLELAGKSVDAQRAFDAFNKKHEMSL